MREGERGTGWENGREGDREEEKRQMRFKRNGNTREISFAGESVRRNVLRAVWPVRACAREQLALDEHMRGGHILVVHILVVRLALYFNEDLVDACEDLHSSTSWGLFDSAQRMQLYNGSAVPHNVSLHEVAAHGPAGL
jgi:hypothetical protein